MIIGLIGRTNVGKSTLFNRLIGSYRAIVTDVAGTTRELLRESTQLYGKPATIVDSPGLEDFDQEKVFIQNIIDEADLLLFVVDGTMSLGQQDYEIRDMILRAGKKDRVLLVVNKMDGHVYGKDSELALADWYALGFPYIYALSAKQEEGVVQLADGLMLLVAKLQLEHLRAKEKDLDDTQETLKLAIMGRPNVGKSTLLNTLVGEDMAWVQDKPGTTLDYISASFDYKHHHIQIFDTAGIRKKGKTVGLEKIAYAKTMKMIEWLHPVVVIVVDIDEGLTHRDKSLIGELIEQGVPLIVALNKIDLYDPAIVDQRVKLLRHRIPGGDWIPLTRISAAEGIGLPKLMDAVVRVQKAYHHRVATSKLNDVLQKAWMSSPPRFPKNKICKRKYITQVDTAPPTFVISVNNKDFVNFAFEQWIKNTIRQACGYAGIPLVLKFTSKASKNPYTTQDA